MNNYQALVICAALAYASPAAADEYFAVTPSGSAETFFQQEPKAVIGLLSSRCIDAKWSLISSSETELVCEAPLSTGQSILGQMLMGNSYSTPPRRFFRYNVASVNGVSRVQASGWMELQMAFGQTRRTDFDGPEFQNSAISFMMGAGGKLPRGTMFPNHVMMGLQGKNTPMGSHAGLYITSVDAGGPAESAGLVSGDIIIRIGSKRLKSPDDWLDATASVTKNATYPVEVVRDGKPKTVTLARAFRPAISEEVAPIAVAPPAVSPDPAATPPPSLADEMAKLAKLKADGVLSEAEFQAAKAKLLK